MENHPNCVVCLLDLLDYEFLNQMLDLDELQFG